MNITVTDIFVAGTIAASATFFARSWGSHKSNRMTCANCGYLIDHLLDDARCAECGLTPAEQVYVMRQRRLRKRVLGAIICGILICITMLMFLQGTLLTFIPTSVLVEIAPAAPPGVKAYGLKQALWREWYYERFLGSTMTTHTNARFVVRQLEYYLRTSHIVADVSRSSDGGIIGTIVSPADCIESREDMLIEVWHGEQRCGAFYVSSVLSMREVESSTSAFKVHSSPDAQASGKLELEFRVYRGALRMEVLPDYAMAYELYQSIKHTYPAGEATRQSSDFGPLLFDPAPKR